MVDERILGIDYVTLKGGGDRDRFNGALIPGDDSTMHLGIIKPMEGSETACHQPIGTFLLTNADIDITCPQCITILTKRATEVVV